jgi:DNA-binding transcriptional LysR family regulator
MQAEIELRWMRLVVAVAEERNFTRAATRCHISQPALSKRVREIEAALGTRLFERHTRSVRITQAGDLFAREARRTIEQANRTVSLVRALATQEQRPVVLGVSSLSDQPRVQLLTQSAARAKSAPSFITHTEDTPELILGLLRGERDLTVVDLPTRSKGLRLASLFSEPLVAVLPERLTLPRKQTIRLAELVRFPLVLLSSTVDPARAVIDQNLSSVGTRAFRIYDTSSVNELLDQVAIHRRAGLLRQSATRFQRQGVVYKPLVEPITVGCGLAWRTDNRSPTMIAFRDLLLTFARQPESQSPSGIPGSSTL